MSKIFKKVHDFISDLMKKIKPKKKVVKYNPRIKVLDNNISYANWIESIERQVYQTKIDYALGWIDSVRYENTMNEYRKKVKDISVSYLEYMKRNRISIPKELRTQFC